MLSSASCLQPSLHFTAATDAHNPDCSDCSDSEGETPDEYFTRKYEGRKRRVMQSKPAVKKAVGRPRKDGGGEGAGPVYVEVEDEEERFEEQVRGGKRVREEADSLHVILDLRTRFA